MATLFISHQFTKEDKQFLSRLLSLVVTKLEENNHKVFCSTLRQDELNTLNLVTYEERLDYCIQQQKQADLVISLLISENASTGMQRELDVCKSTKLEYLLFTKRDFTFDEFRNSAAEVYEYSHYEELPELITQKVKEFLN